MLGFALHGSDRDKGELGFVEKQKDVDAFQKKLAASGFGEITTEIAAAPEYYFAEDYHQQYLAKNPNGYCGLGGTGVSCPVGVEA